MGIDSSHVPCYPQPVGCQPMYAREKKGRLSKAYRARRGFDTPQAQAAFLFGGIMSKSVKFSFDTEEEKQCFAEYAKAKGMTLPILAKVATYAYRAKNRAGSHHPLKEKKDAQRQ